MWLTAIAAAPVAAAATAADNTTPVAPGLKVPSRRGLFKALPDGTPPTPDCPAAAGVHADPCNSEHTDPCNSEPSCGTAGAAWGAFSPSTHWPVAAAAALGWRRLEQRPRRLGRRRHGRGGAAAGAAAAAAWKAARTSDHYGGSSTEDDCDSEEEAVERAGAAGVFWPANSSGQLVRL